MKNDLKNIKGLFVLDNREATLEGIKKIKEAIIYTSGQIKQLHDGVVEEKNIPTMCTAIINNFFWLVDTLDKSKESQLTKDLDYLYKHCLFSIIRVRDFNDYDFIPGCVKVLEDITESWDRVSLAADKAEAFGWLWMSLALYPAIKLGETSAKVRKSISRLATGLNILAGSPVGDMSQGVALNAKGKSNQQVVSSAQVALDLLSSAESALIELAALATRLREIGIADTNSTNDASDTAALNAEAISVSDSIDAIVSSAKFHNIAILGTSAKTFGVTRDADGNTTTIKTTDGITATNVSDATGSNSTADTAIGEIQTSLGHVSGHLTSVGGFQNTASALASIELESAARLMDTNFAVETAKLMKNTLIQKYATSMVSKANEIEENKKLLIL